MVPFLNIRCGDTSAKVEQCDQLKIQKGTYKLTTSGLIKLGTVTGSSGDRIRVSRDSPPDGWRVQGDRKFDAEEGQ